MNFCVNRIERELHTEFTQGEFDWITPYSGQGLRLPDTSPNDPGPRIDGAGDLLVYCGLYLSSWVTEKYPVLFKKWFEEDLTRFVDTFRRSPKYDTKNNVSNDGDLSKAAFSAEETPSGSGIAS